MSAMRDPIRGVALLIVLATLVLATSAVAALTSAAGTVKARRNLDESTHLADDLLRALDRPIVHWLDTESSWIVLPVDSMFPRVPVMHEAWRLNGWACEVQVDAWDQCGLVGVQAVRAASPLRLDLPPDVLAQLDRFPPEIVIDGLDVLGATKASTIPARCGDERLVSCLGSWVTPFNGQPQRININTANVELVRTALRLAQRGGLDQILAARRRGDPANAEPAGKTTEGFAPEIVARSDCWSFRVDIKVNSARRSWWCTYKPADGQSGQGGNWICVQRIAIPD